MIGLSTRDFFQTNNVWHLDPLLQAVSAGKNTDREIGAAIGMEHTGRQGRYHRKPAECLGLVSNHRNCATITDIGRQYLQLSTKEERRQFLRELSLRQPLFQHLVVYCQSAGPTEIELREHIAGLYPGAYSTGDRRARAILAWMRELEMWPPRESSSGFKLAA